MLTPYEPHSPIVTQSAWGTPRITQKLPRNIYIQYVSPDLQASPCKLRAANINWLPSQPYLPAGTPYVIKGVWGCSPNSRTPISTNMRVHITIDKWYDYVVAGKDLLP